MTTMLAAYFGLTFLISWGGVLLLAAPHGLPAPQALFNAKWPTVFLPYLFGPLVASLTLIAITEGRAGYRRYFAQFRFRAIGVGWYVGALIGLPLLASLVLLVLSAFSSEYVPAILTHHNKSQLLIMGLSVGLFGGGLLEEPGWTGFSTPRMLEKHGYFRAGWALGAIWGAWHLLPTYWGSGDPSGHFDLLLFLPPFVFYAAVLPAYRILMVWVFQATRSAVLPVLMHASLTACSLFILAPSAKGVALTYYYLALGLVLWGINLGIYARTAPGKAKTERHRQESFR
jgi:uncharacterized protein